MSKFLDDLTRSGVFGQEAADELKRSEESQRELISKIPVRKPTNNFYQPPADRCPTHGGDDGR